MRLSEFLKQFLKQLAFTGGKIVSSKDCTPLEIAEANACGRMYVDEDGLGFIYFPQHDAATCEECGFNPKDTPAALCAGCGAYREHQYV